jgi:hypothetical protein
MRSMRGPCHLARLALAALLGWPCWATTAGASAGDDRTLAELTPAWWIESATSAQVDSVIATRGARIVDLEVVHVNPTLFTAAFVANAGVYARTWWWDFGINLLGVVSRLSARHARLTNIERYVDPATGTISYAAVMVLNEGDAAKQWWFSPGVSDPGVVLAQHKARPVDIESYVENGVPRYDVVMLANTGSDSTGWWRLTNVSRSDLDAFTEANTARIVNLQLRDATFGRFDALLVANSGPAAVHWWWYFPVTPSQIAPRLAQNGARVVDFEVYYQAGAQTTYAIALVNDSNPLTTRVADALTYGSDGSTGAYLKRVGGPVLASLQPTFVFEPASTIKTLPLLYAMRQVMSGRDGLDSMLTYSVNYSGTCPVGGAPYVTMTLRQTLQYMMQFSDNAATLALMQRYGVSVLNAMAANVVGMTHTRIRHTPIGCFPQLANNPNWMTLEDIGLLFEGEVNGTLLDAPTRETCWGLMINESSGAFGFTDDLRTLVYQEAQAMGLAAVAPAYWAQVRLTWKPGSYWLGASRFDSEAGWVRLPTWTGTAYGSQDYVFGVFIHGALDPGARISLAAMELFRDVVHTDLSNFPTAAPELPVAIAVATLEPNAPNPFNPSTALSFTLPAPGSVRLSIHDLRGRLVRLLADGPAEAGRNVVTWDGLDAAGAGVASGTYVARLEACGRAVTRKLALVR